MKHPLNTQIDHLVVAARTLDEGVQWCEANLGITPGAGGEHVLFGTHNRLFRIANVNYPRAYFEIIAMNPVAPSAGRSPGKRWFDLDSEALQSEISASPRLVHFVANTTHLQTALTTLQTQTIDRGVAVAASRMTANGLLEWQISVRPDGQRLFNGALPTLIEWGKVHPASGMPNSGVSLQSLHITHPQHAALRSAFEALGLQNVQLSAGESNIIATLQTPKGLVALESKGI